jgi:hypothetical protein
MGFNVLTLDTETASLIVVVDNFVADGPDKVPSIPNAGQELRGP